MSLPYNWAFHCHSLQISIRSIQIVSRDLLFVCNQKVLGNKILAANCRWTQTGMGSKQAGSLKEGLHLGEMKDFHMLLFAGLVQLSEKPNPPPRDGSANPPFTLKN